MDVGLNNRNTLGTIRSEFEDVKFFVKANSNEMFTLWQQFSETSRSNIKTLSDDLIDCIPQPFRDKVKRLNDKVKDVNYPRVNWIEVSAGFTLEVCEVNKMLVAVSFSFAFINNVKICFYYCVSKMADYTAVEDWLITHFQLTHDGYSRWNHTDANNFSPERFKSIDKEPRNTIYKKY